MGIPCETVLSEYRNRRTDLAQRDAKNSQGKKAKIECRDDSEEMMLAQSFMAEAFRNPKKANTVKVEGGVTLSQILTVTTTDLKDVAVWLAKDNGRSFQKYRETFSNGDTAPALTLHELAEAMTEYLEEIQTLTLTLTLIGGYDRVFRRNSDPNPNPNPNWRL